MPKRGAFVLVTVFPVSSCLIIPFFLIFNNILVDVVFQEVIPYLNEHMEDNCTSELLGYIRNLVLSRIQVNEDQVQLFFLKVIPRSITAFRYNQ